MDFRTAEAALVPARFVSRPNRFIVVADLGDGRRVEAHLADPGRLVALMRSGARLRLRRVPEGERRRTRFSVALVRAGSSSRAWVSVDTGLANRLAAGLLSRGTVEGVGRGWTLRREVVRSRSRFDFRLDRKGADPVWVEVKSVTCVDRGVARFPDAPTARGRRHLAELAGLAAQGGRAMVLFIVQRGDARVVKPYDSIDPLFAAALVDADRAGVIVRAAGFRFDCHGVATYLGELPVGISD